MVDTGGHRPDPPPNRAALRGAKAALGATRAGEAFWRGVGQVKCVFGSRAGARVGPYFGVLGGLGAEFGSKSATGSIHPLC